MNYYQHHIGDYAAATAHLSLIEDAIYSRLLRRYYLDEEPLPADLKVTARLAGARTQEEIAAVEIVLSEFFTLDDSGWRNKRADAEIAAYREKSEKAKSSARASVNARSTNAERTRSERSTNVQLTINQEPITNNVEANASTIGDKSPCDQKPKREKSATSFPDGFLPNDAGLGLARELGLMQGELSKFADYHKARGTRMKDWQAAWRTWCRNAAQFASRNTGQQANRTLDQKSAVANTIEAYGKLGEINGYQQAETTPLLGCQNF